MTLKFDGFVKSRHTREGGYPETIQLLKKTGFPIKDFGNDGLKKDFLRGRQNYSIKSPLTLIFQRGELSLPPVTEWLQAVRHSDLLCEKVSYIINLKIKMTNQNATCK